MRQQQFGGLFAEDMPSRRQPQPPDTAVGRQEMIVLSFTLLHTPHTPSQEQPGTEFRWPPAPLDGVPSPTAFRRAGARSLQSECPSCTGHLHLPTSHHGPPPPDWCALEPVIMPSPRKAMLLQHRSCEIEELVKAPLAGDVHDLDASYGAPLLVP